MKKKVLFFAIAAVAVAGSYLFNASSGAADKSSLMLSNVEALSNNEWDGWAKGYKEETTSYYVIVNGVKHYLKCCRHNGSETSACDRKSLQDC